MRHSTEGDLHAYLDGALSGFDPDGAKRMEAHLAGCPDCRVLLETERRIRDRSSELLEVALPYPSVVPDFDSIRARGRGAVSDEGPRRLRLAWAASVAVALGAGWMGHALMRSGGGFAGAADRPAQQQAFASRESGTGAAEGSLSPDSEVDAGSAERGVDGGVAAAPDPAGTAAKMAGPPVENAGDPELRDRAIALDEVRRQAVVAAPEPSEPARLEVVVGLELEDADPMSGRPTWRVVPLEAAEPWLGRPVLRHPDLAVLDVSLSSRSGVPVVRVRQRLPDGGILELVEDGDPIVGGRSDAGLEAQQRNEAATRGADPSPSTVEPTSEPPVSTLTLMIGGVRVLASAPVASDSLLALVSSIR